MRFWDIRFQFWKKKRSKSEISKLVETISDQKAILENLNSEITKKEEKLKNLNSDIARQEEKSRIVIQKHKKIFENYEESQKFQREIPSLLGLTKRRYSELNEEKDVSMEKGLSEAEEIKRFLEKVR